MAREEWLSVDGLKKDRAMVVLCWCNCEKDDVLYQHDEQGNVLNYKHFGGDDRKCKDEDHVRCEWLVEGDNDQGWRDVRNVESGDDDVGAMAARCRATNIIIHG